MESVPARDHNKILGRELSATLVAAALKNVATGFVSHALEEAVLAGTRALFGLVGSFWHQYILKLTKLRPYNYICYFPVCKEVARHAGYGVVLTMISRLSGDFIHGWHEIIHSFLEVAEACA